MFRVAVAAAVLAGCFSKPSRPLDDGGMGDAKADACPYPTSWGSAQRIAELDTDGNEEGPALSGDGSRIVFGRAAAGTSIFQPWEAVWNAQTGHFAPPNQLDLPDFVSGAWLSADGLRLLFTGYGFEANIYSTRRDKVDQSFGSVLRYDPFAVDTIIESDFAMTADGLEAVLVVEIPMTNTGPEIYLASRPSIGDPFSPPQPIPELADAGSDCCPTISPDGLQILWNGRSPYGLYESHRTSRGAPWTAPARFNPLDDGEQNFDPQFSFDGEAIVFSSWRSGDSTGLYVIRRECLPP